MIQQELATLLQKVALSDDRANARALILRSVAPLMADPKLMENEAHTHQWRITVAKGEGLELVTASIRYCVDKKMIETTWKKAFAGELQVDPCRMLTRSGKLGDGLMALFNGVPVLTLIATGDNLIELQIGRFDDSLVAHTGTLMGLTRQVIEQDLPTNATQERTALGIPLPKFVIRMIQTRRDLGGSGRDDPPILYPHHIIKQGSGRIERSKLVESILDRLGVYVLVAYRVLELDLNSSEQARQVIQQAHPARSLEYLLKLGKKQLKQATRFNNENELRSWAGTRTDIFRIMGLDQARSAQAQRRVLLYPITLLSTVLARTETVDGAVREMQLAPDAQVEERLAEAFNRTADFDLWTAYQAAVFGDVNVAPLWRAHADFAPLFELGRFVGCVERGAKALLINAHFPLMQQILTDTPTDGAETVRPCDHIRAAVQLHFGAARFLATMERVRLNGGMLAVERRSRLLHVRKDVGLRGRLLGRPH